MPQKTTIAKARRDARQGKSASTQAGEFVRAEIRRIRHGKHGARNTKQAIAIGLSEARRSGVKLAAPGRGSSSATRRKAAHDSARSRSGRRSLLSRKRSRASMRALRREPRVTVSRQALSRQAKQSARRRSPADRSRAAQKAAATRRRTTHA